jgi:soluble lytic murein transglycosylase-like protein
MLFVGPGGAGISRMIGALAAFHPRHTIAPIAVTLWCVAVSIRNPRRMPDLSFRTCLSTALPVLLFLALTQVSIADTDGGWVRPGSGSAATAPPPDPVETASIPETSAEAPPADPLHGLVQEYAALSGIPTGLAHAVITIESRYNPAARNGPHFGLMQLNVATARSMGFAGEPTELLDPATNLRFGMAYLAGAFRLAGGDTCGTIMRYQGGHRATRMSAHAAKYCARVKAISAGLE